MDNSSRVYSVKDVANILGISLPGAYELARRADFPAIRVSPRRIVVPAASFEAWLQKEATHSK